MGKGLCCRNTTTGAGSVQTCAIVRVVTLVIHRPITLLRWEHTICRAKDIEFSLPGVYWLGHIIRVVVSHTAQ